MTDHPERDTSLTDEQIQALCDSATPGPWIVGWVTPGAYVARDALHGVKLAGFGARGLPDAAFVAAARDLVPSLLARAQKAEAERDEAIRDLEAGDACGAVGCRALEDRDRLLAELANAQRYIEQRDDAHGRIADENRALAARLASAEAERDERLQQFNIAKDQRDAAEAKLREIRRHAKDVMDALAEYGPSIVPHLMDNDENAGERLRAALAADTTPEPTVEIGGQVMTQAQFNAARFPLLNHLPAPDESGRSVSPEQEAGNE